MRRMIVKYTGVTLAVMATNACATKGYVMKQVQAAADTSRMGYVAGDNSIKSEMSTQFASVRSDLDGVKKDVASLRQDLAMLRDSVGAKITAMENGMRFAMPVTFAFDDAAVRGADRSTLDLFAKVMNRHYAGSLVTVEGFADPAGSAAYNRRLSEQRAENVIAYLQHAGLSGLTLRPVGLGESRQVTEGASGDMPGADSNRRVVFVVETANRPTGSVTK